MSTHTSRVSITKVLVANRGEIARRIFRTLRSMGLATVAVFSDADEDAPHVHEADEAVRLGPAPSQASYLDQDAVIGAARAVGADAIHPGYGFLAENATFAARCADEDLVFLGPSPEVIRQMGDKAAAKALAEEAGVPVLAGLTVGAPDPEDADALIDRARALGFPLLIKAVAGGGGKGMRIVESADQLTNALTAAHREATAAFGAGGLILERYVPVARHVEVQLIGDSHGTVTHLLERDCSLQRRHQKVFEECPSPAVDADLRERLGAAAVALGTAVGYEGVGTVEFLLTPEGEFFFLEMNTRLQVEHPVTEAVTGLDLVALQVEVARGRPLAECLGFDPSRETVPWSGHAIEARLYAEDPDQGFLPVTGTVALWNAPGGQLPRPLPGLRIDSGVEVGSEVGIHYDPMLAKVIAHGRDRDEALRRLHRGLSELAVGGLVTNRELLLTLLEHPRFRQGDADIQLLEGLAPEARRRPTDPTVTNGSVVELHAIAAAVHGFEERRSQPSPVPEGIPRGWRNNRWRPQAVAFALGEQRLTVHYVATDGALEMTVEIDSAVDSPSRPMRRAHRVGGRAPELVVEIDGVRRRFHVATQADGRVTVHGLGRVSELRSVPRFPERQPQTLAGGCAAPMTGKVLEVSVAEGDTVAAGDTLVVLEAMKMEHRLQAASDGVVDAVRVEVGQTVDPDDVLVVVRPSDSGPGETDTPEDR